MGSILLLVLKKIISLIRFLLNKFDKTSFLENLRFFFNAIIFVIISILIGWIVVMMITKKNILNECSSKILIHFNWIQLFFIITK